MTLADAGHDVEHARRNAGFGGQFRHAEGAQRGLSAGLTTTLLPVARMGPSFHAAIWAGKFHGRTQPTTPSGSRTISARLSGPVGETWLVKLVDGLGVPAEAMHVSGDVDRHAVGDRLAGVEAVEQGDLAEVLFQQIGELEQDVLAFGGRALRPDAALEGVARGLHGAVHIRASHEAMLASGWPVAGLTET